MKTNVLDVVQKEHLGDRIASTDGGPPRSVSNTHGPLFAFRILRGALRSSLATA
jgi:hypothetical protein